MKHRKRVTWRWDAAFVLAAVAAGCSWYGTAWYIAWPPLMAALTLFTWEMHITRRHR